MVAYGPAKTRERSSIVMWVKAWSREDALRGQTESFGRLAGNQKAKSSVTESVKPVSGPVPTSMSPVRTAVRCVAER